MDVVFAVFKNDFTDSKGFEEFSCSEKALVADVQVGERKGKGSLVFCQAVAFEEMGRS